jgi:methionyl-tRNA synthetase
MENKKYYITTPIYYPSDKLHIGNTYTTVAADAVSRFKRLTGHEVMFLTGTDEHGQKIQRIAEAKGTTPKAYVDEIVAGIKDLWKTMNISYDKFIRTTDDYHERAVQKIFKQLYDQGDIYKGYYEGWYCTPCESFFTETQLVDGKCPDCGREVNKTSEDGYFFKLSNYVDKLVEHMDKHPEFVEPISRKNEIVNNFIKPGLQDLCVSRTSFKWGIPVSFDEKHVVYVWIDALSNYITFLGYDINGNHGEFYKNYWPADLQIIGKDILRFHMIYWPIMLMALGEKLPKKIYAHSWYLMGDGKMSKSKGNIIYADDLVSQYGLDAVRYYLLSEMPFANDGLISNDLIVERINADLANTLGNLVNRTISMCNKYFGGKVKKHSKAEDIDNELITASLDTAKVVDEKMNALHVSEAIDAILNLARKCNKYIDETTPWSLAKDETKLDRLETVMYNLLESIRFIGVLLQAFTPDTSEKIFNQLNTNVKDLDSLGTFGNLITSYQVNNAEPLFMRIDKDSNSDVK